MGRIKQAGGASLATSNWALALQVPDPGGQTDSFGPALPSEWGQGRQAQLVEVELTLAGGWAVVPHPTPAPGWWLPKKDSFRGRESLVRRDKAGWWKVLGWVGAMFWKVLMW